MVKKQGQYNLHMNINKIKRFAKNIFAIPIIRKFLVFFNLIGYGFLSISKVFAIPFHFLFNRAFDRESFAFTTGVYQYYKNLLTPKKTNVLIRRNIHRLEKGLIMEPRRKVFATTYIEETVDLYAKILENRDKTEPDTLEIKWAFDVLTHYFSIADVENQTIKKVREKFISLPKFDFKNHEEPFIPYTSKDRTSKQIPTYEQFLSLSKRRRSIRWFENRPVPRKDIDKALTAALQAPSACNRQPFRYLVFDDPEKVREIANIPFGTAGYADQIPTLIVVVGDMSNYFSARDRHVMYIDTSLSVMSFLFALETLGLSSVTINWPDFGLLERKMKKKLSLKNFERPIILLGIGYARSDGKIPFSCKKSLEEIREYRE